MDLKKLFGTDGLRGKANVDLTADYAYLIGRFLALLALKKKRILIGTDTRISSSMLEHALIAGILVSGGDAFCLGVTSTPALAYLTKKHDFDYGVMISASHNPYQDNGIKIFDRDGYKIKEFQEKCIEQYLLEKNDDLPKASSYFIGRTYDGKDLIVDYIKHVDSVYDVHQYKENFILDLANGSLCEIHKMKKFFNAIHDVPNGYNINENCGATSLGSLSSFVQSANCKFGFAFDGDGDRLMGVLQDGTTIDGDYLLYIMSNYLLNHQELDNHGVVTTIMSNMGLKKALLEKGIETKAVQVGDKHVLEGMIKHQYAVGGEPSGHLILKKYATTGDGFLSLAFLLKILEEEKLDLKDAIKEMKKFPQILENIPVSDKSIIDNEDFKNYLKNASLSLGDKGRILVRPSGTESLIRVMVEASELEVASRYVSLITAKIKEM